jgi:hypothetical protein
VLNREGNYVTETERECSNCGKIYPRTSKTVALCNACNSNRVKNYGTKEYYLWTRAKSRCSKSKLEFSILVSDIIIPDLCPYLNIPLVVHSGSSGGKPNSPALDRIDNTKGYTKNNIQVISHLANQMKASSTIEELVLFSKRILETFDKEITPLV